MCHRFHADPVCRASLTCTPCSAAAGGCVWGGLPSCVDSLTSENLSISPVCPRRGLNPPHRVKSISMTTFSQQEVEFLQNHGNEVGELSPFGWVTAADVWMSRLSRSPRSDLIFVGVWDKCCLPAVRGTTGRSAQTALRFLRVGVRLFVFLNLQVILQTSEVLETPLNRSWILEIPCKHFFSLAGLKLRLSILLLCKSI